MAQPTTFNRAYNFTEYQASNPSAPLPADRIDAEFNLIKQTLDEVLANLAVIQRDDTELANDSVGLDQLTAEVLIGFDPPTTWATLTAYTSGDTVFHDTVFYLCETSHTSGTFATDLGAGKWSEIADFTQAIVDAVGSVAQPLDADLTAIAALAPSNDDIIQRKAGAWTNRTIAQLLTDLAAAGTTFQPLDSDLTAIAALVTTSYGRAFLALADEAAFKAAVNLEIGTDVQAYNANLTTWAGLTPTAAFEFVIDGGGAAIATGIKGDLEIPFACTITRATLLGDQSGSIVVDLWADTYANFPPTDADSITAAAPPTISTATKSQDATLTGWTVALAAGSILRFNVDSCTSITRCTVGLTVTRT